MSFTYGAFISYRHLPADTAAAKAIQRALETYRIPGDIRKKTGVTKLKRCFRDQDELPLADDLGASIEKALQESEWLIVICSPDLPKSQWCLREVDYFIRLGRQDRIIPALIAGEPKDSYPPQITRRETEEGSGEVEPLATDLRGNLKKQLKTEKLRIVARMLNLNYNDLRKRERERALRRGLALVSCGLPAVSCVAAYAVYNNHLLTEERNATARNATELLLEKSVRSTTEGDLGSGMAYALQAYQGSRIFETEYDTAVSAALEAAMYPELYSQIGSLKDQGVLHRGATLSNDGKYIACRQADQSLQVYSSATGERLYVIRDFGWFGKSAPDFSPDCQYVCKFEDDSVTLFGIADGKEAFSASLPEGWKVALGGMTSGNLIPVQHTETGKAALFDPFGNKLTELEGVIFSGIYYMDAVELHRSGRRGAWSDGHTIWLVDTENGNVMKTLEGSLFENLGGYLNDTRYFQYADGDDQVFLEWDTLEVACRFKHSGILSPNKKLLASPNGYSGFTLWDTETGEGLWTEGHNNGNTLYSVAFADDDTLIASHGEIQIYRVSDRALVYDSGKDRTTYGYDMAAGRLVMPLQAGGCLINLMPQEEEGPDLPRLTVETREGWTDEDLMGTTYCFPLAGQWNGSVFYILVDDQFMTVQLDEPGLLYLFNDQEYILHPVNGVVSPTVYVSPDGTWQAMIRNGDVDIFRAAEGPEPVMTIPENGYQRLCAAFCGDILALGSYVENLVLYDLTTGDCLGTVKTGAMCTKIQFSPDGRHLIAFSSMAGKATVANTENLATVMSIPVRSVFDVEEVGFNQNGTEAAVLYKDGQADVGLLYQDLDTLVAKARKYVE